MTDRQSILKQIQALRADKEWLVEQMYSDPDNIMPSDIQELMEAVTDIENQMDELEIEYHIETALVWGKGVKEHG